MKIAIRKNLKRAGKFFEATGIPKSTLQFGFSVLAFLTVSWLALRGWIPSLAYILLGAMLWRSVPPLRKNPKSFRAKKAGETCSTAVFLGSGMYRWRGNQYAWLMFASIDKEGIQAKQFNSCPRLIRHVTRREPTFSALGIASVFPRRHLSKRRSAASQLPAEPARRPNPAQRPPTAL